MKITTVGLDLEKNVFHVVCLDEHSKEVKKRMLQRKQVRQFFAQLPPCNVGMEACAGSYYWGCELKSLGHEVKLIPAQPKTTTKRQQKRIKTKKDLAVIG